MRDVGAEYPLISLCRDRAVNALSLFSEACGQIEREDLASWYGLEKRNAPDRWAVGKRYLIDSHEGIPSTGDFTDRNEEHLALAIFNEYQFSRAGMRLPDDLELRMLEYQLPLKARQSDAKIGKVDLFAVTASGQACVIELKAARGSNTPLKAVLQALTYAAIIEANIASVRKEVQERYCLEITLDIPAVTVMAPEEYWSVFRSNPSAGPWQNALRDLGFRIQDAVGVTVSCVSLHGASFVHGLKSTRPSLQGGLTCEWALSGVCHRPEESQYPLGSASTVSARPASARDREGRRKVEPAYDLIKQQQQQ